MTNQDHLSAETSVSAELTENGVNLRAKSRAVAAFDRLLGNLSDWANVRIERDVSARRAKIEGERQLLEAAAKYGVERMGYDPEFAQRAYENNFQRIAAAQENKDAVAAMAMADLRAQPPTADEAGSGTDELSSEFVDRFETYAQEASTEELRERWGKVLASEIRRPGTFTRKVLRVTDELDAETARLFERLCAYRVDRCLFKAPMPLLQFHEKVALVSAGLLVDPGAIGQIRYLREATDSKGRKLWMCDFDNLALAYADEVKPQYRDGLLQLESQKPGVPIFLLTDAGFALSSILKTNAENVAMQMAAMLDGILPPGALEWYAKNPGGGWTKLQQPLHKREG